MHTGPRLIVAAALVAVAGVAPAAPAHAAACEEGGGVTVVVDFASLGGGVETDCASGDPGSGVEALRASGHEPTRAAQQAGYFVCRIDGRPADDPCQRASPADAYWSYWHARPGGSWTYSNTGPAERDPAPGPAPGPSPTPEVPSPEPAATSSRPSPAASTRAVSGPSSPPAAPDVVEPGTDASPSASPSASASPASSATASPELTPGPVVVDRVDDGAGSLAGPLAALGILLLLAAGGAYQVTRRRARDEGA
jgi:hypothetical protein